MAVILKEEAARIEKRLWAGYNPWASRDGKKGRPRVVTSVVNTLSKKYPEFRKQIQYIERSHRTSHSVIATALVVGISEVEILRAFGYYEAVKDRGPEGSRKSNPGAKTGPGNGTVDKRERPWSVSPAQADWLDAGTNVGRPNWDADVRKYGRKAIEDQGYGDGYFLVGDLVRTPFRGYDKTLLPVHSIVAIPKDGSIVVRTTSGADYKIPYDGVELVVYDGEQAPDVRVTPRITPVGKLHRRGNPSAKTIVEALTEAGATMSRAEGRRLVHNGAVCVDGVRVTDPNLIVPSGFITLSVGRKTYDGGREENPNLRLRQFEEMNKKGQRYGVLSAYRDAPKAENKREKTQLVQALNSAGYDFVHIVGSWGGKREQSVLVPGIALHDLLTLGDKFQQEAVIFKGVDNAIGMYYQMKRQVVPAITLPRVKEGKGLYSAARGISFEFDFLWGQELPWDGRTALTAKDIRRLLQTGVIHP